MKPTAPIESLNPADILTTLFANKTGDPQSMAPTTAPAPTSVPFAGQTVRLRIANAVNDSVFNAAVDAVSIASTPPNNVFKKGKLKLNKSNGTATLTVTVPGRGGPQTRRRRRRQSQRQQEGEGEAGQAGHAETDGPGQGQGPAETNRRRQEDRWRKRES